MAWTSSAADAHDLDAGSTFVVYVYVRERERVLGNAQLKHALTSALFNFEEEVASAPSISPTRYNVLAYACGARLLEGRSVAGFVCLVFFAGVRV